MNNKIFFGTVIIFLVLGFLFCCQTQDTTKNNEYKLSGEIKGLDVEFGSIAIRDSTASIGFRFDTVDAANGNLKYKASVVEPKVMKASFNSKSLQKWVGRGLIPTNSSLLLFVAIPGNTVKIKGKATDFVDAYPYGDIENETLSKLTKKLHPVLNDAVNLIRKLAVDTTIIGEERQNYEQQINEYDKEMKQIKLDFLNKNASSIAGLWLMEDMVIRTQVGMDTIDSYLKAVDEKYKTSQYYKNLSKRVKAYQNTAIGNIAPDIITTETPAGEKFDLKSLRGKYVLIDFWGTWCHSCLAGTPHIKEFYDANKDKLEVLGVAKDNNKKKWTECIEEYKMNWHHVLVGKGDNDFVVKYNVQGFPTKILLGKDGKILLRVVGEDPEFYVKAKDFINQP